MKKIACYLTKKQIEDIRKDIRNITIPSSIEIVILRLLIDYDSTTLECCTKCNKMRDTSDETIGMCEECFYNLQKKEE